MRILHKDWQPFALFVPVHPNAADTPELREWYRGHVEMATGVELMKVCFNLKWAVERIDSSETIEASVDESDAQFTHWVTPRFF